MRERREGDEIEKIRKENFFKFRFYFHNNLENLGRESNILKQSNSGKSPLVSK